MMENTPITLIAAANALWPKRKGFVRCPTCKGEFDEGEWESSSECPECETDKALTLFRKDTPSASPKGS